MTANPLDDQFEAATKEANQLWENANGTLDTVERECTGDSLGARIGDKFQDSIEQPDARACPHIANSGPRPIFGAACLPGLIGCMDCMRPLIEAKLLMEKVENKGRTCDNCGDVVDTWHDALLQRGPLLLHVHVCCFCMELDGVEHSHDEAE